MSDCEHKRTDRTATAFLLYKYRMLDILWFLGAGDHGREGDTDKQHVYISSFAYVN